MRRFFRLEAAAWGALALATLLYLFRGRQTGLPRGAPLPETALQLLDGTQLRLEDSTQPTLIAFWATWCGPCRAELPGLDALYKRYRDRAHVVAVNVEPSDAKAAVRQFVDGAGLTLPIAYGGGSVADLYHVDTIPYLVIIDGKRRTVRQSFTGLHDPSEIARALDNALAVP